MARFSTKKLSKQLDKWSGGYYSSGYKSSNKSYSNSSFWLDDDFLSKDSSLSTSEQKSVDYIKLAGYNRAIGNFVRIVTGKDVPVKYSSGKQSYTDGTEVVISAKLDEKEFDSTVGLALHEGSHIALTDFGILRNLIDPAYTSILVDWSTNMTGSSLPTWNISERIKTLVNIIEDRRIDRFIYDSAPGYRGYYKALYDKYFNAKEIDEALINNRKTEVVWENYEFHICNFANPNRQLNALPGLKEIWDMISLTTIPRLKTTSEVLALSVEVWKKITLLLHEHKDNSNNNSNSQDSPESQSGEESNENGSKKDEGQDEDTNEASLPNLDSQGENTSGSSPLSKKAEAALEKAIQAQQDFLKGNIKKKALSKAEATKVNAAVEADMDYKTVGGDKEHGYWGDGGTTQCVVVHGIRPSLWESSLLDGHCRDPKIVKERLDKTKLKTSRLETGRIDRRLIAELGFGNDRVFARTIHNTTSPSIIHISLDASGSMSGDKWIAAMKTAVAIAQAASMVSSLDVIISVRGSARVGSGNNPLMWIVFDSRKEKIAAAKYKLYAVQPAGSTPEGLCYQAVMTEIVKASQGKDSYFINVCDGEPGFSGTGLSYNGHYAITHTANQVQKMRNEGIKVLSYFVAHDIYTSGYSKGRHSDMYGKDAMVIDLNNLTQLSKSLNQLFVRNV
jgi:hypothetical protein